MLEQYFVGKIYYKRGYIPTDVYGEQVLIFPVEAFHKTIFAERKSLAYEIFQINDNAIMSFVKSKSIKDLVQKFFSKLKAKGNIFPKYIPFTYNMKNMNIETIILPGNESIVEPKSLKKYEIKDFEEEIIKFLHK